MVKKDVVGRKGASFRLRLKRRNKPETFFDKLTLGSSAGSNASNKSLHHTHVQHTTTTTIPTTTTTMDPDLRRAIKAEREMYGTYNPVEGIRTAGILGSCLFLSLAYFTVKYFYQSRKDLEHDDDLMWDIPRSAPQMKLLRQMSNASANPPADNSDGNIPDDMTAMVSTARWICNQPLGVTGQARDSLTLENPSDISFYVHPPTPVAIQTVPLNRRESLLPPDSTVTFCSSVSLRVCSPTSTRRPSSLLQSFQSYVDTQSLHRESSLLQATDTVSLCPSHESSSRSSPFISVARSLSSHLNWAHSWFRKRSFSSHDSSDDSETYL